MSISTAASSNSWTKKMSARTSMFLCCATKQARPIVLVSDVGPDPDDAKAILILAILHAQGVIDCRGIVCNGGGQPERRAALAKCLLTHLGEKGIPVGVGSVGKPYAAQPHEYGIPDYENVTAADLRPDHELLMRLLREARPKSLHVVCISSLRDVSDVIKADAELFATKVARVAIQGGLQRESDSDPWKPDTSVNNLFDLAAAEHVYQFCFDSGIPMMVCSRNAVPLLPMRLAKSFADQADAGCVMRYLATAQSRGLEGLWLNLCAGKLPDRCSKQWYFETFCGVSPLQFATSCYASLGADCDIGKYLNGFVKPFVALMTVLPLSESFFRADAWHVVKGTRHLLLLEPKHTLPVSLVHNLLRDVYTEVVLTTSGNRRLSMGGQKPDRLNSKRLEAVQQQFHERRVSGGRAGDSSSDNWGACAREGSVSFPFERTPLGKARVQKAGVAASSPSLNRQPLPLLSNDGVLLAFLTRVIAEAGKRQRYITLLAFSGGFAIMITILTAYVVDLLVGQILVEQVLASSRFAHDEARLRHAIWVTVGSWGMLLMLCALHPTLASRGRLRLANTLMMLAIGTTLLIDLVELIELLVGRTVVGFDIARPVSYSLIYVGIARGISCEVALWYGRRHFWSKERQHCTLLWAVGAIYFCFCGVQAFVYLVYRSLYLDQGSPGSVPAHLICIISCILSTTAFLHPRFRQWAQGWLASLRTPNPEALLAPLLGFGAVQSELTELIAAASESFATRTLTAEVLAAMAVLPAHPMLAAKQPVSNQTVFARTHDSSVSPMRPTLPPAPALGPAWPISISTANDATADLFVCESAADSLEARNLAARAIAERFAASNDARPPRVWAGRLCLDKPVDVDVHLSHLPVYMTRCERLVILWGPELAKDLLCVMQLLIWFTVKGSLDKVHFVPVARAGPLREHDLTRIVSSIDTFHIRSWHAHTVLSSERIELALEIATTASVNALVRSFYDKAARAT